MSTVAAEDTSAGAQEGQTVRTLRDQAYGDLTELNTVREVMDSVGKEILVQVVADYLDLLGTSAAVYEKNGDYALGIFSSGWCRKLDAASRDLCATADNREALRCGRWHCHESCWEASKLSIDTNAPADIPCAGGIRLYSVPITAGDEVVGAINFGYGDPPRDPQALEDLAKKYGASAGDLRREADAYEPRSEFRVAMAKGYLRTAARLIGEIVQRRRAENALRALNTELEERVRERTAELEATNRELDSFSYSVSHDLRAPLRAVNGFSRMLRELHGQHLPADGNDLLLKLGAGAQRMADVIDGLVALSHIGTHALRIDTVQPAALVEEAISQLRPTIADRNIEWEIGPLPPCRADRDLLAHVFLNLLENAVKFSRGRDSARIDVGARPGRSPGEIEYFVRDNGSGFDMRYADKLFGVFNRLHDTDEFEGAGLGLALVRRIVQEHGGRVWAQSAVGEGATFYFTLRQDFARS